MRVTLVLATLVFVPASALACTGIMGTPVRWVRDSEVILRVRAVEEHGTRIRGIQELRAWHDATGRQFGTTVQFEVLEVLKGQASVDAIELEGELTERDDPNDRPAPYDFVRPGGRSGNCFAFHYKKGAEYLLLCRIRDGSLTPHWATLGATNEQLFGSDDRWLGWVRQELKSARP
jgi:hypothetical protein